MQGDWESILELWWMVFLLLFSCHFFSLWSLFLHLRISLFSCNFLPSLTNSFFDYQKKYITNSKFIGNTFSRIFCWLDSKVFGIGSFSWLVFGVKHMGKFRNLVSQEFPWTIASTQKIDVVGGGKNSLWCSKRKETFERNIIIMKSDLPIGKITYL